MLIQIYVNLAVIHFICSLYYALSIQTLLDIWSCGRSILTQTQCYVNGTNTPREMRLKGLLREISTPGEGKEAYVPLCKV